MENQESVTQVIEKLALVIGESGATIASEYATWFIWSSISWIVFGVCLVVTAFKLNTPAEWEIHPMVIKFIFGFVGCLFIAANFGDLLAPQGVAIHQLIKDIRG